MADTKISALSAAATLTGTETVPAVQSGANVKATAQNIANLAAKVNGVAITGTPTAGQVPTATSGTAATWQTPSGGGGGGTVVYGPPAGWVSAHEFNSFIGMPSNRCYMYRCRGGGTITGITMRVLVSSGNISAGVVGSAGGVSNPVTRRATSGAVPCPATGYAVVTIPSTTVDPSDYLALSQDDGAATFAAGPFGSISESFTIPYIGSGQTLFASGAHPIPSTVTTTGTLQGGGHILSGA